MDIIWKTASEVNDGMLRVYNYMLSAIITSGVVSYLVSNSPDLMKFLFGPIMMWVVIFAPLVAVFFVVPFLNSGPPKAAALAALHGFAALMALSLSTVFGVYTIGSIVGAFTGAGILFATMSVYGYFTKQNLDSIGKWLFIGLIAIIIVSVINIFIGNSMLQMFISAAAIVIFLGLTAYDTQKIREQLATNTSEASAVLGALTLYLDFINLFIHLLSLFGVKKD